MSHQAMKMRKINGACQRRGFIDIYAARKAGYCLIGNYKEVTYWFNS